MRRNVKNKESQFLQSPKGDGPLAMNLWHQNPGVGTYAGAVDSGHPTLREIADERASRNIRVNKEIGQKTAPAPQYRPVTCGPGVVIKRTTDHAYLDRALTWQDSYGGPPETVCTRPFADADEAERGLEQYVQKLADGMVEGERTAGDVLEAKPI